MVHNQYGILYVVATPIGNFDDVTLRALKILRNVDFIAAEDTRHSANLLKHFRVKNKVVSLHDFNEKRRSLVLIELLKKGKNIALISDAGTPLISDPGYCLINLVRAEGISVVPVPGACALIAALSVSGLPTNRFVFEGFLPRKSSARLSYLSCLMKEDRTMIFYESSHRILSTILDMIKVFGGDRSAVVARELTKKFETIYRGKLLDVKNFLVSTSDQQMGEFVILIQGADNYVCSVPDNVLNLLIILSKILPSKQVVDIVSDVTGVPKNKLYKALIDVTYPNCIVE